jgi:hypothetical protein
MEVRKAAKMTVPVIRFERRDPVISMINSGSSRA